MVEETKEVEKYHLGWIMLPNRELLCINSSKQSWIKVPIPSYPGWNVDSWFWLLLATWCQILLLGFRDCWPNSKYPWPWPIFNLITRSFCGCRNTYKNIYTQDMRSSLCHISHHGCPFPPLLVCPFWSWALGQKHNLLRPTNSSLVLIS